MKTNYSFPHPVLGRDNDIGGSFDTEMEYFIDREEINLMCKCNVSNKTLQEMLKHDEAELFVQADCPSTRYRKALKMDPPEQSLSIKTRDLRGRVNVNFYLVARRNIQKYRPEGINKDYGDFDFNITEGDILAHDFETFTFPAEKTWERLQSVSSFMQICKSDTEEGVVEYDLDGDKIVVYLSKVDYEKYKRIHMDERLASLFHASVVYPALMYAVASMVEEDSPYKDKLWYLHLSQRKENDKELKVIPWESQKVPKICQIILKNPINRELEDITEFIERMIESK